MRQALSGTDISLARRLESGHAASGMAYARAYLADYPDSLVAFEEIGGGWAVFQDIDSPLTQALNIGMHGALTPEEFGRLEHFYHSRNSAAVIDLCVLADPSVLSLIQSRMHAVREVSNVLVRSLDPEEDFPETPKISVEPVEPTDAREWGRLVLRGFTEQDDITDEQIAVVSSVPPTLRSFFGRSAGERTAVAAMDLWSGIATFFGDATLRHARRSGMQSALISRRLKEAAQCACDLASVSVVPGSISHRNYERAGFQLVYTRIQLAIPKNG